MDPSEHAFELILGDVTGLESPCLVIECSAGRRDRRSIHASLRLDFDGVASASGSSAFGAFDPGRLISIRRSPGNLMWMYGIADDDCDRVECNRSIAQILRVDEVNRGFFVVEVDESADSYELVFFHRSGETEARTLRNPIQWPGEHD